MGQNLYVTFFWTDLRHSFDIVWTEVGFSVQSLSNHPKETSTEGCEMEALFPKLLRRWQDFEVQKIGFGADLGADIDDSSRSNCSSE